eukprot:3236913-Rhodomonas_salina.1
MLPVRCAFAGRRTGVSAGVCAEAGGQCVRPLRGYAVERRYTARSAHSYVDAQATVNMPYWDTYG